MLTVRIHDYRQGQAVLAVAAAQCIEIRLATAPGATDYLGVSFIRSLEQLLGVPLLVDCGDAGGSVMAALRVGLRQLCYSGTAETLERLRGMATPMQAVILEQVPEPALTLDAQDDAARALGRHLGGGTAAAKVPMS